jgi:exopolyphosphatase/guanosine-5'-triphosphate,3'-diphosphate pyrophosphatase
MTTVAAIDCGTNSTRLLVARASDGGGYETLERHTTITRLGEGVDATGRMGREALGRVVECLQQYGEIIDRHDVTSVRMTATSAARDASNREDFFDLAEVVIGVRPDLLSGPEEAELSFRGATADLDPLDGPFLVADIGGGSTEFAFGTDAVLGSISTDMGCVRLTEKYIDHDPPLPEELVACLSIIELNLDDVSLAIPQAGSAKTFVGLAGTVSAAAAIEQGLATYDRDRTHHFELTKNAVEDVFRTLATESRSQRLQNPGMEEGRVDVIVGGLCVLVRIMRQFGFDTCLVSEADILDGLVMSHLSS